MSKADDAKRLVQQTLDKALVAQQPLARKNVERLRRVHPSDTPQELIRRLDRSYLVSITVSGGVTGAAAIAPGAGIPTARANVMAFTEAWLSRIWSGQHTSLDNRAGQQLGAQVADFVAGHL
ncbi:hypothetical protein ACWDA7_49370 [Streptomyces sp. NPDC001156]